MAKFYPLKYELQPEHREVVELFNVSQIISIREIDTEEVLVGRFAVERRLESKYLRVLVKKEEREFYVFFSGTLLEFEKAAIEL
ncbi:hypothetical protein SAMN05421780_1119 [Flexibacter flexilis DSM 6793]|uniref:Uncharacterized protein n=1 Tax=Flexibacter flexilis DSM 6793 TaxID=927664 RepID=A0A1I1MPH3_9BACT|nr:hypothetical protein [Flexibacter flexilis]SFC86752.1 hypothetical protein SAMN05421780_1119 [Flexibacter flexilis DSM 6793]